MSFVMGLLIIVLNTYYKPVMTNDSLLGDPRSIYDICGVANIPDYRY